MPTEGSLVWQDSMAIPAGAPHPMNAQNTRKWSRSIPSTMSANARSFTLSDRIDQNEISAQLDNGVLTLTSKKVKQALPRRIEVQ